MTKPSKDDIVELIDAAAAYRKATASARHLYTHGQRQSAMTRLLDAAERLPDDAAEIVAKAMEGKL